MNARTHRLGLVAALASMASLPFMPILMVPKARADLGIDIGDGSVPLTPTQEFFAFHNALYQQLFGHPAVLATPLYNTLEAVNGPGQYLGYTEDGDLFFFDVEAFLDGEVEGEEVYPGVIATAAGVCRGTLYGQSAVEVQAIVASMDFDGATHHVLVALWEMDTTPDEGPWGWMYTLLQNSGEGQAAAAGGDPCSDPIDGDCMFLCPDIFCADGTQFCPLCEPGLLVESCEIETQFRGCIQIARDDSTWRTLTMVLGGGLWWAGCAAFGGPVGMALCGAGAVGMFYALHNVRQTWERDLAKCKSTREGRYDSMYAGFCNDHGGPAQ